MNKEELLGNINSILKKEKLREITSDDLDVIVLDTARLIDKEVVKKIKQIKKDFIINLNSDERNRIRRYLIGYPDENYSKFEEYRLTISSNTIVDSYNLIFNGLSVRRDNVLNTIISRYKLYFLHLDQDIRNKYLDYIDSLQHDKEQLIYLYVDGDSGLDSADVEELIAKRYDDLSNYHNMIITFEDSKDKKIDWNIISNIAIFMENFLMEENFNVFQKRNKSRRIEELISFLENNQNLSINQDTIDSVNDFYKGVSYGFRFIDLLISSDGSKKTLVMQKVQLDETPKRCPSCFEDATRGNSYPRLLYKSFECQNPNCPSRSKSGRGKRFDLLSAKKQIMLSRNNPDDFVPDDVYKKTRRDIVLSEDLNVENMVQLHTWSGDNVLIINDDYTNESFKGRKIKREVYKHKDRQEQVNKLPIYKLLSSVYSNIKLSSRPTDINFKAENTIMINDNSCNVGYYRDENDIKITSAITSPPYYNAREYSQWGNFISYLIDMMINGKAVFDTLEDESTYIYNVGDIVDLDYVYIKSHMSQKRLMLGFYSALIFNIVGYRFEDDIIWDKGEVQSKRNASPNHFSGYLNPVNSYEHDLVFYKGNNYNYDIKEKIVSITPVRKINSNGDNTYGHTAPYPEDLAKLILPFSDNDYIFDPFLGSGTTCLMASNNGKKSIGIELDDKYFALSVDRFKEDEIRLF